jgi:CNT family concentrative nucleoside transporter
MHRKYSILPGVIGLSLALTTPALAQQSAETNSNSEFVQQEAKTPSPDEPLNVQQELERANILLRLGNPIAASAALRKTIQKEPENILAHQKLRRALIESQQSAQLPAVLKALATLHHTNGQRQQAHRHLQELQALAPNAPLTHELEALLQSSPQDTSAISKTPLATRLRSLLGMVVLLGCAVLLSSNRKKISYRLVAWGLGLQFFFAVIILWTPPGRWVFDSGRVLIHKVLSFTDAGASFLFGNLYNGLGPVNGQGPVQVLDGTTGDLSNLGLIFAFHILPTVIFFGSLMSVVYHLGIVQKIVKGIAWVMVRTMGTSGSESLSAASNIFVGQTEAPLVVRPFLDDMTTSELMAIMVGGFATVAGGVLAAYTRFGIDPGHLLAASVMSAPAALVVAKILCPETQTSTTYGAAVSTPKPETTNLIDAAATGATDGLKLALNVAAMLVAFIALIALLNWVIAGIGALVGLDNLSLKQIFGVVFYPLSWCMGVEQADLLHFGNLLGTKISINEFVAFVDLGYLKQEMSPRSFTIATYALCGFANFSSIGIQIGGISSVAPGRRKDLARIGLKAMAGGAIASWMTACIAGLLL